MMELKCLLKEKQNPTEYLLQLMGSDEKIILCFKTVRDQIAFTNKRILFSDRQGITGKKIETYSIPYSSIHMWSIESAGMLDFTSEFQLWTKTGMIKLQLSKQCKVEEIDQCLVTYVAC